MSKKTYYQKLLDPKWQKKRLEILQRDNFMCQNERCSTKSGKQSIYDKPNAGTLHVHHFYYEKNADPWDYPNEHLVTLCASCHEEVADAQISIMQRIAEMGVDFIFEMKNRFFTEILRKEFDKLNKKEAAYLRNYKQILPNEGTSVF